MMNVSLQKPAHLPQWLRVYRLYLAAFPAAERKPFSIIVKMHRKGMTDVWCIEKDGKFLGFAVTINDTDLILLDYFAVDRKYRGQGFGSAALRQLRKIYAGKGLFVEIESTCEEVSNREERLRRKLFYVNCGMEPLNVMATVFGVKMELLGSDCRMDFRRYHDFYRDNYSPWAAKNIVEACHPNGKEEKP